MQDGPASSHATCFGPVCDVRVLPLSFFRADPAAELDVRVEPADGRSRPLSQLLLPAVGTYDPENSSLSAKK